MNPSDPLASFCCLFGVRRNSWPLESRLLPRMLMPYFVLRLLLIISASPYSITFFVCSIYLSLRPHLFMSPSNSLGCDMLFLIVRIASLAALRTSRDPSLSIPTTALTRPMQSLKVYILYPSLEHRLP